MITWPRWPTGIIRWRRSVQPHGCRSPAGHRAVRWHGQVLPPACEVARISSAPEDGGQIKWLRPANHMQASTGRRSPLPAAREAAAKSRAPGPLGSGPRGELHSRSGGRGLVERQRRPASIPRRLIPRVAQPWHGSPAVRAPRPGPGCARRSAPDGTRPGAPQLSEDRGQPVVPGRCQQAPAGRDGEHAGARLVKAAPGRCRCWWPRGGGRCSRVGQASFGLSWRGRCATPTRSGMSRLAKASRGGE